MNKFNTVPLLCASALLLVACGGGSSGGSSDDNSNNNGGGSEDITGQVGDGYIEGAYVCHDSNNDLDCLDEIYTTTAADGSFTLSNYNAALDLLVQIPVGAVDNGPFSDGSTTPRPFTAQTWYYYPSQAAPANGPIFVGPLSTLVFAQQEAVPGMTVAEATEVVGSTLGIGNSQVTSNYLEDSSSEGTDTQFVGELVGASIANIVNDVDGFGTDIQIVLNDAENVANTANENSASTYNTPVYVPDPGHIGSSVPTTVALTYTPVTDLCADLSSAEYFAFEDWDSTTHTPDLKHKTFYMSNNTLHLKIENSVPNPNTNPNVSSSIWELDAFHTTTENTYLQNIDAVTIDMANVNNAAAYTQEVYDLPLPAQKVSCNGGTAVFNSSGREYKLFVSSASIANLEGSTLPQGPSVGPLVDGITFAQGDLIYKISGITQNTFYSVEKGQSVASDGTIHASSPEDYIVYEEGSIGGAPFQTMANSNDINALSLLTDTDFIIDYKDSNNFVKLALVPPSTVNVIKVENGVASAPTSMVYAVEVHNNTPFFFVRDYRGAGRDIFIGKINSVSSNAFVHGRVYPAGKLFDLTQGGFQDGDVMDDIMINTQARNKLLLIQGLDIPQ